MQSETGDVMVKPSAEKKAYQTPQLLTHGSVAKLTQHNGNGGHSEMDVIPWVPHHRHRWWECL